jgi:hypothetical protein
MHGHFRLFVAFSQGCTARFLLQFLFRNPIATPPGLSMTECRFGRAIFGARTAPAARPGKRKKETYHGSRIFQAQV